jgi:integrase
VSDILSAYATDIVAHRKSAVNISYNIGALLEWWGMKRASEITARNCRAYAAIKTNAAAGQHLKVLRAACNHWSAEYAAIIPPPVVWRPKEGRPKERWLSRSELARLLNASRRVQHLRRFILLAYYTGSRPGVILRLQWDQIDIPRGVLTRIRPEEAVGASKKRAPPVRLGRKIIAHLTRWRAFDMAQKPPPRYLCHYDGRPVDDPHGSWETAIRKAGLPGVTRHTLRHTRATHLMQSGRVSIWEAAGNLGMTTRTLERVYGHHHPDHQGDAPDV